MQSLGPCPTRRSPRGVLSDTRSTPERGPQKSASILHSATVCHQTSSDVRRVVLMPPYSRASCQRSGDRLIRRQIRATTCGRYRNRGTQHRRVHADPLRQTVRRRPRCLGRSSQPPTWRRGHEALMRPRESRLRGSAGRSWSSGGSGVPAVAGIRGLWQPSGWVLDRPRPHSGQS